MIDLDNIRKVYDKPNKKMRYTIGQQVHFILKDFQKPVKKFKLKNTDYLLYIVKLISRNNESVPESIHQLQIPIKTVWIKIYDNLKENNRLKDKDIAISIQRSKYNNYNYDITIHT